MRKNLLLLFAACGIFLFCKYFNSKRPTVKKDSYAQVDKRSDINNEDGIRLAQEMEFEMTKDVSLGYVPKYRMVNAVKDLIKERSIANSKLNKTNALSWTERGPNTDVVGPSNGNTRPGNGATSGRMRAIWIDLADATNHTVWVGGVDGGVWKTTDISASPATWAPVNDFFGNMSIASICQDPSNTNTMYFGTGEKAQSSFFIVQGGGIWKSTDHGVNWSLLSSTPSYWNVSKVICDALGNVYVSIVPSIVATGSVGGIYRSTNGGTSWTNITPSTLSSNVTEMKLSSTGRLHIVCGYSADGSSPDPLPGYVYTDNPSTVTTTSWSTATGFPSPQYNSEIGVSGNTLYVLNSNSSFQTPTIYKSTDGGANWAPTTTSPPANSGTNDLSSGQAWYNLAVTVDPANGNNVIVGGLNCYRSTNGGSSWSQTSYWVGTTGNYIHADQQTGVWNGTQVLIGSDGGIFYSSDGGLTFSDRNTGLRLKQFYSCAIHPTSANYFLAGAQDNGTHQLNNPGLGGSTEVKGGDGAFVHIDQDEPQYQFAAYVYSQYRRSTDGGNTWTDVDYSSSVGQFINPTDYDDGNNKMYTGGAIGQYIRWEDPQTGNTFTPVSVSALGSNTVRSIIVSPYTSNRVFFGTAGGRVVQVDNANTNLPVGTNITGTGMPTTIVSSIAIGTNDNNLIATYSNYGSAHIWVSTTGGGSGGWTNISGNLPDIPVRWAMFYPYDNTKAIIATEMGVYETSLINGSSTVWTSDPSFPTVLTAMLQYRRSDNTIVAATHGRGLWTATIPIATPYVQFATSYATQKETTSATSGCRGYKDYTFDMTIAKAPTGTATLTLNIAGGATATYGVDYDFTTNGSFSSRSNVVTFTNGSTAAQQVTIRVYDDDAIEGSESFTLNYTLSGTTDAQASPSNQALIFTITDNDSAPGFGAVTTIGASSFYLGTAAAGQPFDAKTQTKKTQMLYLASELTAMGLTAGTVTSVAFNIGVKNSTRPYLNFQIKMGLTTSPYLWNNGSSSYNNVATSSVKSIASYSTALGWNTFSLDNPFVWDGTSNIVIETCYDNGTADGANFADQTLGYNDGSVNAIGTMIWANNLACGSPYSTFTYYSGGSKPQLQLKIGNPVETVLNSAKNSYLGPDNDIYFYSAGGNIMARITSTSALDYGCSLLTMDRAGNGVTAFWNNTPSNYLATKTFHFVPTTNNSSGTYSITLYYTAAEKSAWESATGNLWSNIKMVKVKSQISNYSPATPGPDGANAVEIVTPSLGTFGSDYTVTATFSSGFSGFGVGIPGLNPLPITLLNFQGHLENAKAVLNWSTSSEQNSKNFEIEKSADGTNYYKIGSVAAAGNSLSQKNYSFTDQKLSPVNYYRLKMNDIDGRNRLSHVVVIRYNQATQNIWVVNNPFNNYIDLRFAKPGAEVKLQLINVTGVIVSEKIIASPSGQIRWNLQSNLGKGSYVIRAIADGQLFTSKVVKQ